MARGGCILHYGMVTPGCILHSKGQKLVLSENLLRQLKMWKHGKHTSLGRQCSRPSVARRFFAYNPLSFEFKGKTVKLKNVAHAIYVEKLILTIFFNVLLLSYKPLNFTRAILPYAAG